MAERDGLENRCTLTGTEGSNPSLSANNEEGSLRVASFFFFVTTNQNAILNRGTVPFPKIFQFPPANSVGDAVSWAASAGWTWTRLDGGA